MTELALIMVSATLVNNLVLAHFVGLSSLPGAPRKLETALWLGLISAAVTALSVLGNHVLLQQVLSPLGLMHLRLPAFALLILAIAQIAVHLGRNHVPQIGLKPAALLPLLAGNAIVLGSVLHNAAPPETTAIIALFQGLAAGLGFTLVLVLFTALRERLTRADIPVPFRGAAIEIISLGLMSLAFMGFNGLVKA
ncbi:electron transport complex subunit RsxA [Pseudomonas sp. ABC1]|uniref:electron transport complex protein RnfA n=1 Tax=Pseudomonas sp. ABC1 TaxID=2748080 RepID=UPI0015C357DD|nr:Rnf-Nqr domain containing protein [Pseudomonas sp. ABC1]QLF94316.1 electron transport complex subunit RsxA [Pseudomonas sp. ABC1]